MIANFFWSGKDFQFLDKLTILSHLSVGHEVVIWLWGQAPESIYWPSNIPKVTIKNADEIVSCSNFYEKLPRGYPKNKRLRVVSAYWKFHFMYQRGGLYCDTDAIALKPFPSDEWINVLSEDIDKVYYIGILKAPPNHPVFKYCIENIKYKYGNPRVYSEAVKKYGIAPTHNFRLFYPFSAVQHNRHLRSHGTTILFSAGEIPDAFSIHIYGNKISALNIDQAVIDKHPNSILCKITRKLKHDPVGVYLPHKPKVAVLILSWLRLDELIKTLKQIPNSCNEYLHLTLRVQGSENLTEKDRQDIYNAARGFLTTDIYFTRSNVGTAAGRLDLLHRASKDGYEYLLSTDNDMYFPPSGIDKQVAFLNANPEAGGISLCSDRKTRVLLKSDNNPEGIRTQIEQIDGDLCELITVGSAALMFRSEVYTKHLIAPDSAYYLGGWDLDFAYQMYLAGYKIYMFTNLIVDNRKGGPPEYTKIRRDRSLITDNITLFKLKWGFSPYNEGVTKKYDISERRDQKSLKQKYETFKQITWRDKIQNQRSLNF